MRKYTFQICRTTLALSTELPLVTGEPMELFAHDGAADLRVVCRGLPEVPEAAGALRFQSGERLICQSGTAVARCRGPTPKRGSTPGWTTT